MNLIFCLNLLILISQVRSEWSSANYTARQLLSIPGYGQNWIYLPDETGEPQKVFLTSEFGTSNAAATLAKNTVQRLLMPSIAELLQNGITFDLYTRKNPEVPYNLILDDVSNLNMSGIDFNKDIKMITHGWLSSNKSVVCQNIKKKYLEKKDVNVIVIDWAPFSKNLIYTNSKTDTKNVGDHVSKFIRFLVENGARLEQFHLIGHSLGAHVLGFAGAEIRNGRVKRITGLDPAKPFYQFFTGNNGRLDASDAEFVDIIHTCAGALGYSSSIGTADFYPNGGNAAQPGCFGIVQVIEACSHSRSYEFFEDSIGNPGAFPSVRCKSWHRYKKGECLNEVEVPMGEETLPTAHGDYFLATSEEKPFRSITFEKISDVFDDIEGNINQQFTDILNIFKVKK